MRLSKFLHWIWQEVKLVVVKISPYKRLPT